MDIKKLNIIYMGSPEFSAKFLEHLIIEGYNIIAVITQPDAPFGRKKMLTANPVKNMAITRGIKVFTPPRIRDHYEFIYELPHDLILTFAYGQILPQEVLDAPRIKALNFHGSLLPKYRGASPIQYALMNNDLVTGVTLMEMIDKMDAGKMYGKVSIELVPTDNFATVADKMVEAAKVLTRDVLPSIVSGENEGVIQEESEVTFAKLLKKEDEILDVNTVNVDSFIGRVRAFAPHIGASLTYLKEPLKIYEVIRSDVKLDYPKGYLVAFDQKLFITLSDGVVEVLKLKKAGKKEVDGLSFTNGEKKHLPYNLIVEND